MHFKHMFLGFLAGITKYPLKNHRYIAHEIYGIIMDNDLPWKIEVFFGVGFAGGFRSCYNAGLAQNTSGSFCMHALSAAFDSMPSLATHEGNANIRRFHFKRVKVADPQATTLTGVPFGIIDANHR